MTRKRETPDDRVLPHDLEAEAAVLGAILIDAEALERASGIIGPDDFFRRAHRMIFAAMRHIVDEQHAEPDPISVRAVLEQRGDIAEVGGPAYITKLTDGVPRAINVEHYAGIVKEQAQYRRLIAFGTGLVAGGYDRTVPAVDLITEADRTVVDMQRAGGPGRLLDVRQTSTGLYADLEYRVAHRGELSGVETGFASINEITGGWQRGEMIVIAARPSIGKTAFALNTAVAAARAGHRVAIFSLEMRRLQLEYRLLASIAGMNLTRIQSGNLGDWDYETLGPAMTELSQLPIWIDDRGHQTVWDIRAGTRRMRAEHGLDLIVVDYLQLMSGSLERRNPTRNEELTDISRRLKILADEVNAVVLAVSQLNRGGSARDDKRPRLEDLRESGAIEQDADTVAFLHRRHHLASGTTQFILEKQRNGPGGTLNLTITRETQVFVDGGEDPPPEPMKTKKTEAKTKPLPYDKVADDKTDD